MQDAPTTCLLPVPRPHSPGPVLLLVVVGAICTLASVASAQTDSAADQLVRLRLEWLTQLARRDAATRVIDSASIPPNSGLAISTIQDPGIILRELGPQLDDNYRQLRMTLVRLAERTAERRDYVYKGWAEIVRRRVAFREDVDRRQASYGFDFDSGAWPGLRPTTLDVLLLIWAVVVLVVALRLRRHELRLERRRVQRIAAATVLLGLASLPGCGRSTAASDTRPWVVREQERLTAAVAEMTTQADTGRSQADRQWQTVVTDWARLVASPGYSVDGLLHREEGALHERLQQVVVDARLAEYLARDAEEQRQLLAQEQTRFEELVSKARWRTWLAAGARVAAAVILLAASIAPYWSVRQAQRSAARLRARACPRCGVRDKLENDTNRTEPRPGTRRSSRKSQTEPQPKEPHEVEVRCQHCGLRIRRSYLSLPRFCIPTVGVRSSGKTHMLLTAYDRIRKRTAPTIAVLQPAPSTRDRETETRFEQLIDIVLHHRGEAGATDLALPNPILVHLRDADPAGPNSALVNLFDYSGELINPAVDVNLLRQTAVRMDGFMLFLDPTQLYGDGANVTLDQQLAMLDEFLDHMRRARGVPVGQVIPVPVAVCIPKFDLLVSDNPIGRQAVRYIRELVTELSPPPRETTLAVLQERSDRVEQMLPLMFPGVDIPALITGYFGPNLLFFPMSSVSLFERELGVRNLEQRTIAPWGVTEPILWLMHMHGYDVFAPDDR